MMFETAVYVLGVLFFMWAILWVGDKILAVLIFLVAWMGGRVDLCEFREALFGDED